MSTDRSFSAGADSQRWVAACNLIYPAVNFEYLNDFSAGTISMTQFDQAKPVTAIRNYRTEVISFAAGDGRPLDLLVIRGEKAATKGPVLMVHGAGVRAQLFMPPVQRTLVDALIESGYEPWLLNWRASIALPRTEWTLDQAAVYDHPVAVKEVVRRTGAKKIKAIIHCQGSTSFTMSAVAGLVPEVECIVSNAVSLHPVVPAWSRFKLDVFVPFTRLLIDHLNPHWGVQATGFVPKMITALTRATHHECNNTVCKLVSFAYGAGCPALWSHDLISEATHEWLKDEFGYVPLRFHAQMAKCVAHGSLVSVEGLPELPSDFVSEAPRTDARFAFFAGEQNRCFLPESQQRTFDYFDQIRPGYHSLHRIANYGHLDVFFGDDSADLIFPKMIAELDRESNTRDQPKSNDGAKRTG